MALSPGPPQQPQQPPQTIPPQTPAERAENDRLRDRLEKALQVNQLLYNFLEKHTQNQFQTRDATELEAGRLAKELEKAQMHLAKQQETNESTRIEFERMSAELNRFQERLERSEAEKEQLRQQLRMNPQQNRQQIEQAMMKLDQDAKKLTVERCVSVLFWMDVSFFFGFSLCLSLCFRFYYDVHSHTHTPTSSYMTINSLTLHIFSKYLYYTIYEHNAHAISVTYRLTPTKQLSLLCGRILSVFKTYTHKLFIVHTQTVPSSIVNIRSMSRWCSKYKLAKMSINQLLFFFFAL